MNASLEKNALIIIPQNQFCEKELFGLRFALKERGVNIIVLSKSGREGRGMKGEKFQPDGMVVDWDKQPGIKNKFHTVILIGGKGSRKSLWNDPIVPQILTDHYRSGSVIGAIGSSMVVLMTASLMLGEIPLPEEEEARKKLESLSAVCIDIPVTSLGRVVCGRDANSVDQFSNKILNLMEVN